MVNNISINNGNSRATKANGNQYASVYEITGVTRGSAVEGEHIVKLYNEITAVATNENATTEGVYKWNQIEGQKASSNGNIYGIYDLSGGIWERTSSYLPNGYGKYTGFNWDGTSYIKNEYVMQYAYNETVENANKIVSGDSEEVKNNKYNISSQANYEKNTHIYGNAIHETSTAGTGNSSWHGDFSFFTRLDFGVSVRGGGLLNGSGAGLLYFSYHYGDAACHDGFRPVVVAL